jgi:cysteinyl-tRNA synthetase
MFKPQSYNSITRSVDGIQYDNDNTDGIYSKNINWYICGPTVYSDAHIGHARTYLAG